jgi:hypothetical protein
MNIPDVDRDQLIWALSDNTGMTEYYLDLETGEVFDTITDAMEVLGINEDDLESERYWYINPLSSHEAHGFMVEFIETVSEEVLKRRLSIAVQGRGAFRMFKATLLEYPEERERWFRFHQEKMKNYADEWLKDLAITLRKRE